jgi:uracil-DNA glycosylase family 4
MQKIQQLRALQQAWAGCKACSLCEERNNVVFGAGAEDAQVLIIGEAPGENEDRHGLPFVGQAGQILHQFLGDVSARQEVIQAYTDVTAKKQSEAAIFQAKGRLLDLLLQEFYFTNIVMCRPPENRDPIPKESAACRPRLLEQIYLIDPVIIVAAGRIAAEALLGKKVSITQSRGELLDLSFEGRGVTYRYPVMPVLHPSYIMRRNDYKQAGGEAEKTRDDFLRVMRLVDEFNLNHYGMPRPALRPLSVAAERRRRR